MLTLINVKVCVQHIGSKVKKYETSRWNQNGNKSLETKVQACGFTTRVQWIFLDILQSMSTFFVKIHIYLKIHIIV